MAEMLPPECSASTRSPAERKVFEWIRRDLGGEWTGLHSVGEATHHEDDQSRDNQCAANRASSAFDK